MKNNILNFTTVAIDTGQLQSDIITGIYVVSAMSITYLLASILLRPIKIFKMRKFGSENERSINYTTRGDLSLTLRIPFMLYSQVFTARFIFIDEPTQQLPEYTLPFDIPRLKNDIEILYSKLRESHRRAEALYDEAEQVSDWINEHRDRQNEVESEYSVNRNRMSRIDMFLDNENFDKMTYCAQLRKLEAVYKHYDITYKSKPGFDWEED